MQFIGYQRLRGVSAASRKPGPCINAPSCFEPPRINLMQSTDMVKNMERAGAARIVPSARGRNRLLLGSQARVWVRPGLVEAEEDLISRGGLIYPMSSPSEIYNYMCQYSGVDHKVYFSISGLVPRTTHKFSLAIAIDYCKPSLLMHC